MPLKQLAMKYLPGSMQKAARKFHYRNSLKHYDINVEPELHGCRKLIEAGDMVLDIGANIGVYTRFCSEFVGPTGQVYSLEPVPETFSYLENNVHSLRLRNVKCFNYAASDHDSDSATMNVPQYAAGGSNLYESSLSDKGDVKVKVAKLDTLFPDQNPQFIKCDVEGHELACILGSRALIERCRPKWMIEVSTHETIDLLKSLGYAVFYYADGEFLPLNPAKAVVNYFFFPV